LAIDETITGHYNVTKHNHRQSRMIIKDVKNLEKELTEKYGAVIGNADLRHLLGYKSYSSFNRAVRGGLIAVRVFEIENRRGKFALTKDVATWLDNLDSDKK